MATAGNKQGIESPDTAAELARIHESQKARGKNEPVDLPPVHYETCVEGEVVDEGEIKEGA